MILRFEDAVAIKCRIKFYLKNGSKVSLLKVSGPNYWLTVDLTSGTVLGSVDDLIELTYNV